VGHAYLWIYALLIERLVDYVLFRVRP
jgi:hypothetical protein